MHFVILNGMENRTTKKKRFLSKTNGEESVRASSATRPANMRLTNNPEMW
jgi:hypothetical protein